MALALAVAEVTGQHPWAVERDYHGAWIDAGLTWAQQAVLLAILRRQPAPDAPTRFASVRDLADDLRRSPGTIHRHVATLEAAGWIITEPPSGGQRRPLRMVVDNPGTARKSAREARAARAPSARAARASGGARVVTGGHVEAGATARMGPVDNRPGIDPVQADNVRQLRAQLHAGHPAAGRRQPAPAPAPISEDRARELREVMQRRLDGAP